MAKAAAPTSLTGGQGFNFEDHVAARFLIGLLGARHPLDADLGRLVRVAWQVRDAGWLLDDLLVTFGEGEFERAVAISAKNYKQVTQSGFPDHFVRACWEQWLGVGTHRQFRVDRDMFCLITGELADGVREAWDDLVGQAAEVASTPARLVARMQPPAPGQAAQSSEFQRSLFSSLHCPADLQNGDRTNHEATATLLRHIRLVRIDAESTPSTSEAAALAACQSLLTRPTSSAAQTLWDALRSIASRKRGRGGSAVLSRVLSRLAGRIELADHPDFHADWTELDRRSRERYQSVGLSVGGRVRWRRSATLERVRRRFRRGGVCAVVGPSGVGKSALLRRLGAADRYRVVWLTADLFVSGRETGFEAALDIRQPFLRVLESSPERCLVVFDGVEGFSESGLQLAARVVSDLRTAMGPRGRIAFTVQPDGLNRIRSAFAAAGSPPVRWQFLTIQPPAERVVEQLLGRFPALATAARRPEFRSLLGNLKVFDWLTRLATDGGLGEPEGLITLTAVIDRLWSHFVEGDADGLARSALLKRLAGAEADELSSGTPLSFLSADELRLLPRLESFALLRRLDERVWFAHDLLADCARLKLLVESRLPDSAATVRRAAGVGWFRAVRLYAQRLLEQSVEGVVQWLWCVASLETGGPERLIVRDLFLDALVVSGDAGRLLTAAWPALIADSGRLLTVLLERFAYVGTVPDTDALGRLPAGRAATFEHLVRVPYLPYWAEVFPVLSRYQNELVRLVPGSAAKLLRLWLTKIRPHRPDTRSLWALAADLAIAVAREVQACCEEWERRPGEEVKADAYVALLWASVARPDTVAQVCLELARRRPEHEIVRARRDAAEAATHAARADREPIRPLVFPLPGMGRLTDDEPARSQWPDGPEGRVDDEFRKACLDREAILPLVVNRPQVALEVLLAVVIEPPGSRHGSEADGLRDSVGLHDEMSGPPPMYDAGPFLTLFRTDGETPVFALRLLCRVVNFATERWREHHGRRVERYGRDVFDGPDWLTISGPDGVGTVEWPGDRHVLRWHEGLVTHPKPLSSMLMALEKWLYEEVESGRPIDRWVEILLRDGRSAAIAGVLVQVARFRPELLAGPLLPLVGVWELYSQEIRLEAERTTLALWSMGWMMYGESAWNQARDWHCMPHRKLSFVQLVGNQAVNVEPVRTALRQAFTVWESRHNQEPENTAIQGAMNQFKVLVRYWEVVEKGETERPTFDSWLQAQQQEAVAVQQQVNAQLLPLVFPTQCRKRIDESQSLTADELPVFWESLLTLAARPENPTDEAVRIADSVYGGIAVLVLLHRDWLRTEPEREAWCRERLASSLDAPPPRRQFEFAESVGDWNWDTFAGECGVALLAENPADALARHLTVCGLICFRYTTVAAVMRRAYRLRDHLGPEFERMVAFATDWSMRRWKRELVWQWQLDAGRLWRVECVPRLDGFVRQMPVQANSVSEIDDVGRVEIAALHRQMVSKLQREKDGFWKWQLRRAGILWVIARLRTLFPAKSDEKETEKSLWEAVYTEDDRPSLKGGIPAKWPGVDTGYLRHAFAWIELADADSQVSDRAVDALSGLLAVTLRTVPAPAGERRRESARTPTKFDQWVLERVAAVLVKLDRVGHADDLWRPILALGYRGQFWLKFFLADCFRLGSQQPDVRPEEFVALWGRLIEYAVDDRTAFTRDRYQWWWEEDIVCELLGFEMGAAALGDKPQFARPIGELAPTFARAASRWFGFVRVARAFCRFALKPAGAELLVTGIRWLADAALRWGDHELNDDGLADVLVDVLREVVTTHRQRVIEDESLRIAFLTLTGQLVAQGHHAAFALREQL